jgi:hypothetical protein
MKNTAIKNLIFLGIIAIFFAGVNFAQAYDNGYRVSVIDLSPAVAANNIYAAYPTYAQPQPYTYVQAQQPVQYVQQPVQYVQQPVQYVQQAPTQVQYVAPAVQYVQQQPAVQYVNTGSTQGASVIGASVATPVVKTYSVNTGVASNTGQFVSYEGYNQNQMVASAYNANPQQVLVGQPVDTNGVTALTVNGSGSFMPSSVFQWIMLILLILAIVIVARMLAKKSVNNDPHSVPAH